MKKILIASGQSTLEFILTFSVVIGFVFLFFKTALNYTDGFMVHFATYMASRSYLVLDPNRFNNAAEGDKPSFNYAKDIVFKKYLPDGLVVNFDGEIKENNPESTKFSPFIGIYTDFKRKFSVGFVGSTEELPFRSESFLGREPTRREVYEQECAAIVSVTGGDCGVQSTLEDNGG